MYSYFGKENQEQEREKSNTAFRKNCKWKKKTLWKKEKWESVNTERCLKKIGAGVGKYLDDTELKRVNRKWHSCTEPEKKYYWMRKVSLGTIKDKVKSKAKEYERKQEKG